MYKSELFISTVKDHNNDLAEELVKFGEEHGEPIRVDVSEGDLPLVGSMVDSTSLEEAFWLVFNDLSLLLVAFTDGLVSVYDNVGPSFPMIFAATAPEFIHNLKEELTVDQSNLPE